MDAFNNSWSIDFPSVIHFVDHKNESAKPWKLLETHPDYEAAKNQEDYSAALRLVHDILKTPENQKQLKEISEKYKGAIIVPIRAVESNGENYIPEIFARYISNCTGLDVDDSILQINKVNRTGKDEWYRFAFRPKFDGNVKEGEKYILVDDIFSNGGSLNELRLFIERNGGKVIQTAVLALGGHGDKIAPEPDILKTLLDKHGINNVSLFLKENNIYGGNYKALTNPEAFALRRARSIDEAREKVAAAKNVELRQMGGEGDQKNKEQRTPPVRVANYFCGGIMRSRNNDHAIIADIKSSPEIIDYCKGHVEILDDACVKIKNYLENGEINKNHSNQFQLFQNEYLKLEIMLKKQPFSIYNKGKVEAVSEIINGFDKAIILMEKYEIIQNENHQNKQQLNNGNNNSGRK